jgi:hypothetical protein
MKHLVGKHAIKQDMNLNERTRVKNRTVTSISRKLFARNAEGMITLFYKSGLTPVLLTCFFSIARAQTEELIGHVSSSTVVQDGKFNLTYTTCGSGRSFLGPDLSKFNVLEGPIQRNNVKILNGNFIQELEFNFKLCAKAPGRYTIGPASIELNGKRISSNVIPIVVTPSSGAPATTMAKQDAGSTPKKNPDPFGFFPSSPVPSKPTTDKAYTETVFSENKTFNFSGSTFRVQVQIDDKYEIINCKVLDKDNRVVKSGKYPFTALPLGRYITFYNTIGLFSDELDNLYFQDILTNKKTAYEGSYDRYNEGIPLGKYNPVLKDGILQIFDEKLNVVKRITLPVTPGRGEYWILTSDSDVMIGRVDLLKCIRQGRSNAENVYVKYQYLVASGMLKKNE